MIGKEIRLKRLMPTEDGKYFGLTVDHAMGRGEIGRASCRERV